MEEDAEIPYLLRYLMEDHSNSRGNPDGDTHAVTGTDNHTVNQIVNPITDQVHGYYRMQVAFRDRDMAVPPADELFQDEEDEDARYHIKRGRQAPTEFLKRFREQVNKSISKESPGCKTDEEEQ